jgi:C4-dicarboxylate transporter/malic acid transport protein
MITAMTSPSIPASDLTDPLATRRWGFRSDLDAAAPTFGYIGPNWFAVVMGTGIIANAAATLPFQVVGLIPVATAVWMLDVVLLVLITGATFRHWLAAPSVARNHVNHPIMSHFYGAPAMAVLTVGAGAMLLGYRVIGTDAAVALDAVLWTAGTAMGLTTAVLIPYKAFTAHRYAPESAFGGWLMPVVPPMVSAATGALLLPHLPAGQWQLSLLLMCYAMFGLSLVASLIIVSLIWGRLMHHDIGAAAAVPTLWIVLGPVGQSITATHNLGQAAPEILGGLYGPAFQVFALVYGLPMWGFAMLWFSLAAAITVRTIRRKLPFSLTWWSFTFPVGTVVTGTSALAVATGADVLIVVAGGLYLFLVVAWLAVASRTARGVYRGSLLQAP